MAKITKSFTGDFDGFIRKMHKEILRGSYSASFSGGSDFAEGETRLAVRVYERPSMLSFARVCLTVTLLETAGRLHLTMIATGGSRAIFFRTDNLGEKNFMRYAVEAAERCGSGFIRGAENNG